MHTDDTLCECGHQRRAHFNHKDFGRAACLRPDCKCRTFTPAPQPNAPEYVDPSEERTQVDPFAPTEHPSEGRAEIRRSFRWVVQAVRVLGAL